MSLPEAFARLRFAQPARARANLHLVRERLPGPVFALLPTVLGQIPDPGGALNYLERFSRDPDAAGRRRGMDALARQPALLHYLLALFSYSCFLSETLIQQPDLILWLGRDKHLARLKSKERKSTRLNSSHSSISYAVFCLKKIGGHFLFLVFFFIFAPLFQKNKQH